MNNKQIDMVIAVLTGLNNEDKDIFISCFNLKFLKQMQKRFKEDV